MFGKPVGKLGAVGRKTISQRAIAVLRRFGLDAHIYLPGVGMLNGLTAGNYLHTDGVTPGKVDDPVGLVLDAAGGLGADLLSDKSNLNNATARSVVAAPNALGKFYKIINAVGLSWHDGTGVVVITSSPFLVAPQPGPGGFLNLYNASGATQSLALVEVREVTGIAASQPTTSNKCILRRGAVNLLTYSGDFSNAAWTKNACTVSGAKLIPSAASGTYKSAQSPISALASTAYTVAFVAESAGYQIATIVITGNNGRFGFDLSANNTANYGGVGSQTITDLGGGRKLCVCNVTTSGATGVVWVGVTPTLTDPSSPYTCDGVSGVNFFGAALFQGTYTAQQIQALGGIPLTTTAPASTALGQQYWSFDGSNDSLALGVPLFQMADDHCVVAGVSPQSGATKVVVSPSFESASNYVGVLAFTSAGKVFADWCGTSISKPVADPSTILSTSVATARKTGNTKELRINGVFKASDLTVLTPSAASTTGYIGSFGGSSLYSNGNIYPVIAIKGTVTDPDLLLLEKFVANLSGVTL